LLAYAEDEAGGLMNPRFARLRPDMTVDEAISYLRLQGRTMETIYYAYVLDAAQRLMGVVSFRDLFTANGRTPVSELMNTKVISVREDTDQEEVARLFASEDLPAIPVVDQAGRIKGIVTVDDIVDVVQEEATEDIQKIGGMEALDGPYLETGFWQMVRKRAGWLAALFLGEMLTATAMARYEEEIAQAVVLAVFIPLIISSGGNSGSQASTLIVRAMALGEVRLRDWWRVARREVVSGAVLGSILASIGFTRILVWQAAGNVYGEHAVRIGATVALSLAGVVMFGTVAGSMLPFLLRRAGFDPASASAPFVATLVDVSGLIIYFTVAQWVLRGTLL
jgi:magnesium transporter